MTNQHHHTPVCHAIVKWPFLTYPLFVFYGGVSLQSVDCSRNDAIQMIKNNSFLVLDIDQLDAPIQTGGGSFGQIHTRGALCLFSAEDYHVGSAISPPIF